VRKPSGDPKVLLREHCCSSNFRVNMCFSRIASRPCEASWDEVQKIVRGL